MQQYDLHRKQRRYFQLRKSAPHLTHPNLKRACTIANTGWPPPGYSGEVHVGHQQPTACEIIPTIQSTRRERPATVNTEVAKNLSAVFAPARATATKASDSPNQQKGHGLAVKPSGTATVKKKDRWNPTLRGRKDGWPASGGCHQETSPRQGESLPKEASGHVLGVEKHHQCNPGRG